VVVDDDGRLRPFLLTPLGQSRSVARRRTVGVISHLFVAAMTVAYAFWFSDISVVVQDGYGTFGYDMGIFDQGVWLLSRFHTPFVTVMGRNLFGDHTSFALLLAVPIYWVDPAPQALLVLQTVLLAAAAIPIYLTGRLLIRNDPLSALLAGAFLANPALQDGNLEQFHPEAFLTLGIATAIYAAVARRRRLLWVAVILCLLTKEDAALLVIPLGVWIAFRRSPRLGLTIVAVAVAAMAFAYEVVIRSLLGTTGFYADRIPFGGWQGTVRTLFEHPGRFWSYLRSGSRPFYVWQLGCATGWVWILSPELAAVALLTVAENLLSRFSYMHSIDYHYSLAIVPVLAAGTVWAVSRLATPARRQWAVGLVAAAALLSCWLWGLAPWSRNPYPYVVGNRVAAQINAVADAVPPGAILSADDRFVPHVAHRVRVYQWPTPFSAEEWGLNTETRRRLPFAGQVTYLFLPTDLDRADTAVLDHIKSGFRVLKSNASATLWERR
jgi:uncharacterized membrane protein